MAKKKRKIPIRPNASAKAKQAPKQVPIVVISDIEKLSFTKFIRCSVTNDLSPLVVSGVPSKDQLFFAWISILSAYYTIIGSKDSARYVKLVAKMEALNGKIFVVKSLCDALRQWYEPKLADQLRAWGFNHPFTGETLLDDLKQVEVELSNDNFKLEKLRLEYDRLETDKKKSGEAATKESYMKMLYAIEKHRQMRYPPDSITLYEFAMWQAELIEYSEAVKKATSNAKYRAD